MATVFQYFDKDTFVPEKNYFSTESVECVRQRTEVEDQLYAKSYKWSSTGFYCISLGCLVGFILALSFAVIAGLAQQELWYIGTGFGIFLFIGGIIFASAVCWPKENKYSELLREYRKDHREELWAEATKSIREYNEEQKRIAEAWRAKHPLEELIRACIKDPISSVDIANLARYYAEIYLKEAQR